jgi:hypothetical protein
MSFGRTKNVARRPVRPDSGFLRDRRRNRKPLKSLIEGTAPASNGLLKRLMSAIFRRKA